MGKSPKNKSQVRKCDGDTPVDHPNRRRLPPLLRRAWFGLNQSFRRRIAQFGVTPDQFTVLRILQEGDCKGITQRELASTMAGDPNTVTSLLNRMETSGLVERAKHETDSRAHRIKICAEGKKLYKSVRPIAVDLQEEVLSQIPLSKRDEFFKYLEAVANACHEARDKK